MLTILFSPKADAEYLKAYAWYEERLAGLGERFEYEVERKLSSIAISPLLYPVKKFDVRECLISDFPYLVIYKHYPEKELIYVISIFHTSRHPKRKIR